MEHFNLLECIHNHNNIEDWHCFHNNHHHHNCRHHCWSHRYKNHLPLREKNVWVFFTLSLSDLVSAESQVDPKITGVSALVGSWAIWMANFSSWTNFTRCTHIFWHDVFHAFGNSINIFGKILSGNWRIFRGLLQVLKYFLKEIIYIYITGFLVLFILKRFLRFLTSSFPYLWK